MGTPEFFRIIHVPRKGELICRGLWLVGLMLNVPVNSYGHVGTIS